MKKIIAAIAGWLTNIAAKDWALRRGWENWAASLFAATASALVSSAILST